MRMTVVKTQGKRQYRDDPWDSQQHRANTEHLLWRTAVIESTVPPNASEMSRVLVKRLTTDPRHESAAVPRLSSHAASTQVSDTTFFSAPRTTPRVRGVLGTPWCWCPGGGMCNEPLCVTPFGKGVPATSAAVTWHTVNPLALQTVCDHKQTHTHTE